MTDDKTKRDFRDRYHHLPLRNVRRIVDRKDLRQVLWHKQLEHEPLKDC